MTVRKLIAIAAGGAAVGIGFLILQTNRLPTDQFKEYRQISYQIDNREARLLVADTLPRWQKGLMFVKKPVGFDGMIFIFPDKDYRQFWNKNTLVDLDIYWYSDNKLVGKDHLPAVGKENLVRVVESPAPANRVIEIIK